MKCSNCGSETANESVCSDCGKRLGARPPINWVTVIFCSILVAIFTPVGLCGAAVIIGTFTPKSEYDRTFIVPALVIAVPSLIFGSLVVYVALQAICRGGRVQK